MKILDKLKNALFEEEYVEVEEKPKPVKKEKPIAQKMVLPDQKKEKRKEEVLFEEDLEPIKEVKKEFKFPAILEDDFIDLSEKPKEQPKKEPEKTPSPERPLYAFKKEKETKEYTPYGVKDNSIQIQNYGSYEKKIEKKEFRPSPIISPIYGVIDEAYQEEELPVKKEVRLTSSYSRSKLDVDSVREKAYGNSDDIFEEELMSSERIKKEEPQILYDEPEETNVLLDITDTAPTVPKVTVGDAEEYFEDLGLEYNVDYKDASHTERTGRRSDLNREAITEKEETEDLEDNLFDLIDSMYEEKKGE